MSSGGKPVLGYWKIRGLGQPIRLLLEYLEADYEDKQYEFIGPDHSTELWLADKEKLNLDFPNLPYLLDGSNRVTETRAIMKYLCRQRKPEMLGKTPEIQTNLDTLDYFIYDFWYVNFVAVVYTYSEEQHKEFDKVQPVKLGYLSKFLKDKKWLAGDDISYVDFFLYELFYQFCVFDATCLDKFENLKAYKARMEELPAIKKFMSSPGYLKGPCCGPMANRKI